MAIMELNATLLHELSTIAMDEQLLGKAIKAIQRIKRDAYKARATASSVEETPASYTLEELHARIDRSTASYRAGQYSTSEEMRLKHPIK